MGKTVVVVDDDALVLESMRGVLKSWGCDVVTATSLEAAVGLLATCPKSPDIVISDYHLNDGTTGFDVIRLIRRTFGALIPAFLMSGDTAPERLREAQASGYYLLHKPVLPITLRAVVSELLKERGETEPYGDALRARATCPAPAAAASPALPPQQPPQSDLRPSAP